MCNNKIALYTETHSNFMSLFHSENMDNMKRSSLHDVAKKLSPIIEDEDDSTARTVLLYDSSFPSLSTMASSSLFTNLLEDDVQKSGAEDDDCCHSDDGSFDTPSFTPSADTKNDESEYGWYISLENEEEHRDYPEDNRSKRGFIPQFQMSPEKQHHSNRRAALIKNAVPLTTSIRFKRSCMYAKNTNGWPTVSL